MENTIDLESDILETMKRYFGTDTGRIQHAQNVLKYAKDILKKEKGVHSVVIPAAILHDIGIKECERKYSSTNGQLQEKEGPPIAGKILKNLHIDKNIIAEICQIIASHHSPGEIDTVNFKIIWDADLLVNLKDERNVKNKEKLEKIIAGAFLTETGRMLAMRIYIEDEK